MADAKQTPKTLNEQVASRIKQVDEAWNHALVGLDGALFKTDANKAAAQSLRSLRPRIDSWADSGRAALKTGKPPSGRATWSGWIDAGQIILDGITSIEGEGSGKVVLDNITTSVAEAVKEAPKRIEKTAKAVAKATGETVAAAATPLALPLGVLAVAGVAGLLLVRELRK